MPAIALHRAVGCDTEPDSRIRHAIELRQVELDLCPGAILVLLAEQGDGVPAQAVPCLDPAAVEVAFEIIDVMETEAYAGKRREVEGR